jgi:hypothetical protein
MAITKPDTYDHDMYGLSSNYNDILTKIEDLKNMVYDPNCDTNAVMKKCMTLLLCMVSLSSDTYSTFDNVVQVNQ